MSKSPGMFLNDKISLDKSSGTFVFLVISSNF